MTEFVNHLLNGLSVGCIYALIAVGYSMVYGIIKLINFAHGEFYMFGAFVGYFVLCLGFGGVANGPDLGFGALLVALLAAGLATGVLAVCVERAVYRPLRSSGRIVALLAALGVSLFMQNAGQQTVGARDRTYPNTFTSQRFPRTAVEPASIHAGQRADAEMSIVYERLADGNRRRTLVEPLAKRGDVISGADFARLQAILQRAAETGCEARVYAYPAVTVTNAQGVIVLALLLATAALYFLVQRTRFGRAMRAVSHDFEAASLMGINVNRVVAGTFFIGAVVAGIGGTLNGMYYSQASPLMGLMPGLKAFVAAVFGGIGSVPGALLGGLLLGTSEKLVEAYWSSLYSDAFTFTILILVLLVRPSGLLGRPPSDKV